MRRMFCLWDTKRDAPAYTMDRTLDVYRFKRDAVREHRRLDDIGYADGLAVREITLKPGKALAKERP